MTPGAAAGEGATAERGCRCEATMPASILDGFACGAPDCWRTVKAEASFAAFVEELKRKREPRSA